MHISITHSFQTDFVIFQFSHTFILPTFSFQNFCDFATKVVFRKIFLFFRKIWKYMYRSNILCLHFETYLVCLFFPFGVNAMYNVSRIHISNTKRNFKLKSSMPKKSANSQWMPWSLLRKYKPFKFFPKIMEKKWQFAMNARSSLRKNKIVYRYFSLQKIKISPKRDSNMITNKEIFYFFSFLSFHFHFRNIRSILPGK